MKYNQFKIHFEAFYWKIWLLYMGFCCAQCVAPEGLLCEVSSNTRSREVTWRMFITLNARYLFTLMLILVLDWENLAFGQLFWVLKISAKTTILLKISSKLTAKPFFDCSMHAIFTSWMANSASVLLYLDYFWRWVDRLLVVFQFQWIQMDKNLWLGLLWSTNSTLLELVFILGIIWVSTFLIWVQISGQTWWSKKSKKTAFSRKNTSIWNAQFFSLHESLQKTIVPNGSLYHRCSNPQVLFSYSLCSGRYPRFSEPHFQDYK